LRFYSRKLHSGLEAHSSKNCKISLTRKKNLRFTAVRNSRSSQALHFFFVKKHFSWDIQIFIKGIKVFHHHWYYVYFLLSRVESITFTRTRCFSFSSAANLWRKIEFRTRKSTRALNGKGNQMKMFLHSFL